MGPNAWHRLLEVACGIEEGEERNALVDAAMDWIDVDNLARANGVSLSPEVRTTRTAAVDARSTAPKPPPYNPGNDAKELYEAMHGGMFGAGTDEGGVRFLM